MEMIPPHLQHQINETNGLRKLVEYLWDGNNDAFSAIYFIKSNYKQWPEMLKYLKDNKLTGQKLVDFFRNESPDGGGYHLGAMTILSRIKGKKHSIEQVKVNELL